MPNNTSGEYPKCSICRRKENQYNKLTWQLYRQNITLENEHDITDWMEQRRGKPSVLVLPDAGGILAYSVAPYCDGCLNNFLREYEEHHTTSDKVTRSEFQSRLRTLRAETGWNAYTLQLEYLAPRGFPNLVITKDDRLILASARGDVTVRPRAFHSPAHSIVISPEVPHTIREQFHRDPNQRESSNGVAFLYMDEKYPDLNAPPEIQVTSLTGLLVASDAFPRFRDRFFKILPGFEEGAKNLDVEIHASNLFPNRPDEEHLEFYEGLVSLVNELDCRVYRRGFNFIPSHLLLRKTEGNLLGLCFRSLLISVEEFENYAQIWPVMETDGSPLQDRNFAGYMRWMGHATAHLQATGVGVEELIDDDYMVDNTRFGDLHYVTKNSIAGIAVDCLAYLLHCMWLDEKGFPITAYKARLAAAASALRPSIIDDYIGSFRTDIQM